MGGGGSSPAPVRYSQQEVEAMVRTEGLAKENENLRRLQKVAEQNRDEQRELQANFMRDNKEQMAEYAKLLKEGGARDKGLDHKVQTLEAAAADAERKLKEQDSQVQKFEELMALKEQDVEKAVAKATDLNEKYLQLEKDKEDWKKAEEEKSAELMKESPPPKSLRKVLNDPNGPLLTHEMACIAVMGRAGTGKSTMINKLAKDSFGFTGDPLKQSALSETTMGCPAPVFLKNSDGRDFALFDRPGVGLKALEAAEGQADPTTNFIREQGLKWWTAIILNLDRDATSQEALIYSMCQTLKIPILVTRNKAREALTKEKNDCKECGDEYDETKALKVIDDYITTHVKVAKGSWLLVDSYNPDQFQWKELVAYIEKMSRKLPVGVNGK